MQGCMLYETSSMHYVRLDLREVPYDLPKKIYRTSKERYLDQGTQTIVAIKRIRYKGRMREFALVYRETSAEALLITLHPLKQYQKLSRIKSKRWQEMV